MSLRWKRPSRAVRQSSTIPIVNPAVGCDDTAHQGLARLILLGLELFVDFTATIDITELIFRLGPFSIQLKKRLYRPDPWYIAAWQDVHTT